MRNTKTFRQILIVIKYRDYFCFWGKKQLYKKKSHISILIILST